MKDTWIVARWEFIRNVRSKTFLLTTLLIPLIIVIGVVVPNLAIQDGERSLVIVDEAGGVYESIAQFLEPQGVQVKEVTLSPEEIQAEAVKEENKEADFLFIPADFFTQKQATYYFHNSSTLENRSLNLVLDQILKNHEMQALGLSPEQISRLEEKVQITPIPVDERAEGDMVKLIAGQAGLVVFAFLVVFTSMMTGAILLQSIIKEKNDRIVEILLSSVSSKSLMAGKILATLMLGIIQMVVLGGIGLGAAKMAFKFPLSSLVNINLLYSAIYAILAFLMIATLYAFLGAIMKEAQSGGQTQPLLGILPVVPIWFFPAILANPFGTAAMILSYFPPCTPMTMVMRIAMAKIPFWEIGATMLLLLVFDVMMVYFVARIFKTGLLMYGKDSGFKEAWKWFRQAN